jgi:hypothetical protein
MLTNASRIAYFSTNPLGSEQLQKIKEEIKKSVDKMR